MRKKLEEAMKKLRTWWWETLLPFYAHNMDRLIPAETVLGRFKREDPWQYEGSLYQMCHEYEPNDAQKALDDMKQAIEATAVAIGEAFLTVFKEMPY